MKTGCNTFYSGTDDTCYINTIVLIKTLVFNGNKCMLQIFWYLINRNGTPVRSRCH